MGMYGRAAIKAVQMIQQGSPSNPESAWDRAIALETASPDSRKKSCPRGAFLGLCSAGVINGVKGHASLELGSNGDYARRMVKALRSDEEVASDRKRLWRLGARKSKKDENGQVDVVLALWNEGLIERDGEDSTRC
jgi:hypothetical protein